MRAELPGDIFVNRLCIWIELGVSPDGKGVIGLFGPYFFDGRIHSKWLCKSKQRNGEGDLML